MSSNTKHISLHHHESVSDKRTEANQIASRFYMQKKHGKFLLNDKYFNPNLKRHTCFFEAEDDSKIYDLPAKIFSYLLEHDKDLWEQVSFTKFLG